MSATSAPVRTPARTPVRIPVRDRVRDRVRAGARAGARAVGTATSRWRPLPDFVVVGTKRGGTTSMFRALQDHPQVLPMFPSAQRTKSPHYFDLHPQRGDRWYRSHFPTTAARRRAGVGAVAGEASPYYLFHPHAPARLAATLPEARLVVMLRDPVDRAVSHHWDRVKNGIETLPFLAAVEAEDERLRGELERMLEDPAYQSHAYEHFSYLRRGRYAEQLRQLFEHVDRACVLVLRSEDFYADPQAVYDRTTAFLGLSPHRPDRFGRDHGHADRPAVGDEVRTLLAPRFTGPNRDLAELLGTDVWW